MVLDHLQDGSHTNSTVCVDARVARSPSEVLLVSVRNVLHGLRVTILFSKPIINHIDVVGTFVEPCERQM